MADQSPFAPGFMPEGAQSNPQELEGRWRNFFADPASNAALVSMGLQMAQPMGFGQTPMGHIARSIGAGGEAATRALAAQEGDVERESKQIQREAQANAATSRAETARANSETAATRAAAYQQNVDSQADRREVQNSLDGQRMDTLRERQRRLELENQLFGENEERKRLLDETRMQLNRSRAGYYDARTTDIPTAAGVRQQNADTRVQDATTRQRAVEGRQASDADRIAHQAREGEARRGSQERIAAGRQAVQDRQAYDNYRLLGGKDSFDVWKQTRGGGGGNSPSGTPSSPPAPQPAPSQPQTPPTQRAGGRVPSQAAIDHLNANPDTADQFDAYFGPGSAARILNKGI